MIVTCKQGVNSLQICDNDCLRTTTSAFVGSLAATASLVGTLEGDGLELDLGESGGIGFGAIGRKTSGLGGMSWCVVLCVADSICPWTAVHCRVALVVADQDKGDSDGLGNAHGKQNV